MAITDWPAEQRPRERLLALGSENLTDAELLAIFLRTGCQGLSAVELASSLLDHFGGLRPILEANSEDFCSAKGLGVAKYTQLQAVLEMARRFLAETLSREAVFASAQDVKQYLMAQMRHCEREVFALLHLDSQNRLLHYEPLFEGTINSASVYPREVVRSVIAHNSAAVILAHNHPSGVAEPSFADRSITERLQKALGLIDVTVLDHLIVGDDCVTSFAERGLL